MKLERLESVPDEVDEKLFGALMQVRVPPGNEEAEDAFLQEPARAELIALAKHVDPVWRSEDNSYFTLSRFGLLNGLFMSFCPGYRLMVTEGPNEPRRLWVCKEVE